MNSKEVAVQACFKEQVKDDCQYTPMFALVALVTPGYDGVVYCEADNSIVNAETPVKIDLDKDGCFKSPPLIPNSSLNVKDCDGNPGSYYEVVVMAGQTEYLTGSSTPTCCPNQPAWVGNGSIASQCYQANCGYCSPQTATPSVVAEIVLKEKFILDDRNGTLPACVDLVDVLVSGATCDPSAYQCEMFKACETSWEGIAGNCIIIEPGDHPDGLAMNGHNPTLSVQVSTADGNAIDCTDDGLFVPVFDWDCTELEACSVGTLADVDPEGIATGEILQWNGSMFVPGVKAQVEVADGDCISGAVFGSGSVTNPYIVQFSLDISGDPENQAVCNPDGVYVPPATIAVEGNDGECASTVVTGSGTLADPVNITTDVKVSANAGNQISCETDGLYSPDQRTFVQSCFDPACSNPLDVTCVDLTVNGSGSALDPYVVCSEIIVRNDADNVLECTNDGLNVSCQEIADQIGLGAGRGLSYNPVGKSLSVKLSSDPNNIAQFGTDDGVFVPSLALLNAGVQIVGVTTDCTVTKVNGLGTVSDPFEVCTTLNIDNTVDNFLVCGNDGLLVEPPVLRVDPDCDDSCVALSILGSGTATDPFLFNTQAVISTLGDNCIVCEDDGLYVPCPDGSETKLQVVGEDCASVDLTGQGTNSDPYVLTVGVDVDPSLVNLLSCGPSGLFVGAPDGSETRVVAAPGDCATTSVFGAGTSSAPYTIQTDVKVSTDPTNIIGCTASGLYAQGQYLGVAGSDCVDLVLSGDGGSSTPWLIEADIIVSPKPDNFLSCDVDGLHVVAPTLTANGSNCLDLSVSGSGTSGDPFIVAGFISLDPGDDILRCGANGLTIDEDELANTINILIDNGDVDIPVSAAPNQCLSLLGDGLFVPCVDGSETVVQYTDGDCTNASIVGSGTATNPYVLQTDVVVAGDPNNLLVCTGAGLFVPAPSVQVTDSLTIDQTISGLGTQASPYDIRADLVVSSAACNAVQVLTDGVYVQDKGNFTLHADCDLDPCLDIDVSGDGSCNDPYVFRASVVVSADSDNTLVCVDDGLFVPTSGVINQSLAPADDCLTLGVSGSGSTLDPYYFTGSVIVDTGSPNLLSCDTDGLIVRPSDVEDIVRSLVGDGLTLDGNNDLAVDISSDPGNCLGVGGDFGLYVACPTAPDGSETEVQGASSTCIDTTVTGTGTSADPYVVTSDLVVDPDPCNALSCGPNGLITYETTGFEIGQEGILDAESDNPYMWRAWCDGEVNFRIASLGFGSTSNAPTNFEIIDQSGSVVYAGNIPAGGAYDLLSISPISVSTGQGFAARVVAPFPGDSDCDPACGLVIQGTFTNCCS